MNRMLLRGDGLDVQRVPIVQLSSVLDESVNVVLGKVAGGCVLQEAEDCDHILSNELLSQV